MHTLNILLYKRKNKSVVYLIAAIVSTTLILGFTPDLIMSFAWWKAAVLGLFIMGDIIVLKGLFQYYTYNEVKLNIESDGKTISFYNQNIKGKIFNRSKKIDLTKMQRLYIVVRKTRYFMTNYSLTFERNSKMSSFINDPVDIFPSLFEAAARDRNSILQFVKSVYPGIHLGYESAYQKAKK